MSFYKSVLGRLIKRAIRGRPDIAEKWLHRFDNAPCLIDVSVTEVLTSKGILVVPYPPYSPVLSPCEFLLFPGLKPVKDSFRGFWNHPKKLQKEMLKTIMTGDFQHGYEQWEQRLNWSVIAQGNYFEGNNVNVDFWKNVCWVKNQSLLFCQTSCHFLLLYHF